MKKILFLLLIVLSYVSVNAQYGNEWIDYSKTYYKFRVGAEGLYKVPYGTLLDAGLGGLAGNGFRLYREGEEVPLYASSNTTMSGSDYLEFYAYGADGNFDGELFEDASFQLHQYTSLFTDSITYYIAWEATSSNSLITDANNDISSPPAAEPYFMHTALNLHENQHFPGTPFRLGGANNNFADFENGEGFVSGSLYGGNTQTYNLSTPAKYTGGGAPNALFEAKVIGRSDDFTAVPDHHVLVDVGNTPYFNLTYEAYDNLVISGPIFSSNILSPTTPIEYTSVGDLADTDISSFAYTQLTYPRQFDFDNADHFSFTLVDNDETYLEIANFDGGTAPVLLDITNRLRFTPILQNEVWKVVLPAGSNTSLERKLFISNTDNSLACDIGCGFPVCTPNACTSWRVQNINPINFTDFSQTANQGNYIIISHPSLHTGTTNWVQTYADYRSSAEGGNYNVVVADIEELYDQFALGMPKHPLAIRNFINQAIDNWSNAPGYLFLLGKSISYDVATTAFSYNQNLVPTFGHNPSDNMLGVRGFGTYLPQLSIGRLSAVSPIDIERYLEKVIQYETPPPCTREERLCTKNILHIAGGHTTNQANEFTEYLNNYEETIEGTQFGGTVVETFVQSSFSIQSQPNFDNYMNDGAVMITLVGHSTGISAWNFDIGNATDYNYDCIFPFMFSGSCFVGDIHTYSAGSMSEEFVLAYDNGPSGAIGFLATVQFGFPKYLDYFCDELYINIASENYGQPIGYAILQALNDIYLTDPSNSDYLGIKITSEEFTYEGDPGVILAGVYENPEYIIENNGIYQDVRVINPETGVQLTGSPISVPDLTEIDIQVHASNIGAAVVSPFEITVSYVSTSGDLVDITDETFAAPLSEGDYTITVPLASLSGQAQPVQIVVSIDSDDDAVEDCEDNNQVTLSLQIQEAECSSLAPPTFDLGLPLNYCVGNDPVNLSASPNPGNGLFTGNGVNGTTFDPSNAGLGNHTITYSYTDTATGCDLFTSISLNVSGAPTTAFSPSVLNACVNTPIDFNIASVISDAAYTWDFNGEANNNEINTSYTFDTEGTKTITLNASANGCEASPFSLTVNVEEPLDLPDVNCGASTLTSVTFEWAEIADAEGYIIYVNGSETAELDASTLSWTQETEAGNEVTMQVEAIGTGVCPNPVSLSQPCIAQDCIGITPVITNLNELYCASDPAFVLEASPATGTFFLEEELIEADSFNPSELAIGTYTISYNYAEGDCDYPSSDYEVTITDIPSPVINGLTIFCAGASTELSVNNNFTAYEWSDGNTTDLINVTEPGTYFVSVTNENGCVGVDEVTVELAPEETLTIESDGEPIICNNQTLGLIASAGFVSYQWSDGNTTTSAAGIISPGVYTVTATDAYGCIYEASIEIETGVIDEPVLLIDGSTEPIDICDGQEVLLDAGEGYATYTWNDGSTSQTLTINDSGVYSVTVTNEAGCDNATSVPINSAAIDPPVLNATLPEICLSQESTISISGDYDTYLWSNGETTASITVNNAADYTVTVSQNGCENSASYAITFAEQANPSAAFVATGAGQFAFCTATSLDFANNSENADNYSWTVTNDDTGAEQTSQSPNPSFDFEEVGSYTVSLIAENVCDGDSDTFTETALVRIGEVPTVEASADVLEVCPGDAVVLQGETSAESFTWYDANDVEVTNLELVLNETATFFLEAYNPFGCSARDEITITVEEICALPNAITPANKDGFNDTWLIPYAYNNASVNVEVFNRWGQLVYNQYAYDNAAGWDGRNNNGDDLPDGTYYYIINLNDGTSKPLSGHVTILR